LTTSPVYADSGSGGDNTEVADEIRMHMETAGLKAAEISEKLTQLEEKLSTGMSFKDSCTHCHTFLLNSLGGKNKGNTN
jgi:hypothetical protein